MPINQDDSHAEDLGQGEEIFDLDEAIHQLVGQAVTEIQPDGDRNRLFKLKKSAVEVAVRQKRSGATVTPPGTRPPSQEKLDDVKLFLWEMCCIEEMTPELNDAKNLNLRGTLKMLADPVTKMPALYQNIAEALYDTFQAENWGEPVIKRESPEKEGPSPAKKAKTEKDSSTGILRARDDHPVFGINGCMHHILRRKVKMIAYYLDPVYAKENAKVFGANGLEVGMCWPMQMAALRDGAHGARMGGISGSPEAGAYSIVISGMYDDVDQDRGEELYYSAARANRVCDEMLDKESRSTKSLIRSVSTKNPVRVLRTSLGRWEGVPEMGIRYDGLYQVTEYQEKRNFKGGTYLLFHLVRLGNQVPIARDRPNKDEKEAFERVKEGY